MQNLTKMNREELIAAEAELRAQYRKFQAQGLKLDMSRGKPGADQLDISEGMLSVISSSKECIDNTGMDTRNYGALDGLPEAKNFFADVFGIREDQLILGGNSSLTMMYDTIAKAFTHGICEGCTPWGKLPVVKFLCPSPGYDRHFAITEHFGVELITIRMNEDGPDMDSIDQLIANDDTIKGIWCVPKYSNPEGKSYSDDVVRRFASLKPAAKDFRIMWDNAYAIHHLSDEHDEILNILDECEKAGHPDLALVFASTSKVTFPGGGVALLAASAKNISYIKKLMFFQTIGPDKINQLRHVRYFKDAAGVEEHMKKQAEVLRPKFEVVLSTLTKEFDDAEDLIEYNKPRGGYFVSVNVYPGCAKRTVQLAKEAGVVLTSAGATFPYGLDPLDRNIRIAPTFPPVNELKIAMELFCLCVKLASCEKLLEA